MPEYDHNRTYVFYDEAVKREVHVSERTANDMFKNRPRFRLLRSYVPKVTSLKKVRRKGMAPYDKIKDFEETDIKYIPPPFGNKPRQPKTWLNPLSAAESEPPEGYGR